MNDFLQMDIFFFITSVFATILVIVLAISSYFIFSILIKAKRIAQQTEELMKEVKQEGLATVASFSNLRKRAESKLSEKNSAKSIIMLVAVGLVSKIIEIFIKSKVFKK